MIPYVKTDAIEFVLSVLNDFHKNIKFTYETEGSGEINFLDVLLLQKRNDTETKAYRAPTYNDMYLNWDSFDPESWKQGTLKKLLLPAHI